MGNNESAELLAKARKAWADKNSAQSQMNRLARYKRMTSAMGDDYSKASKMLMEAEATLQRILGETP